MRLTVVGCSGSMSGPQSPASCYLLRAEGADGQGGLRTWTVVMDLGPGAMGALLNYVDPAEIDLIALSHLHADHVADLVGMQVYRKWHPAGCLPQLDVLGPAHSLQRLRGLDGGDARESYSQEFAFREHDPAQPVQVGPMTLTSFPVRHPVPAFGLRVTGPGERGGEVTVAFTGDTDTCDTLIPLAQDADLLLSEAAFQEGRDQVRGVHLTGKRAGAVASEAGARRLVLTHLQPWTDPAVVRAEANEVYDGPIDLARAGDDWYL
ncbi:MBL fold metallo-hydrolase [Bogoriella caseilytica]|uniref:Ribonuclease BN (tRNA processing enzyme) n=1 Tax=Bogoriella caseilytica TaxID=56055 RepID=A0A3N2BEX9_9MICO|nr:MBL fold metallo-hydrolase [Bogoriella caseilytica]ROR73809.1 ribonuclease BN (tRNA processing enzyme) [Bogoriella caseilytica]